MSAADFVAGSFSELRGSVWVEPTALRSTTRNAGRTLGNALSREVCCDELLFRTIGNVIHYSTAETVLSTFRPEALGPPLIGRPAFALFAPTPQRAGVNGEVAA